jgi:hypothetical protein
MKLATGIGLLALIGCGDQQPGSPELSFAASTVVFPDTVIGHVSSVRSIAITNVGTDPVAPTFALPSAADFEMESNTCASLLPGATCEVMVQFQPQALGARTGRLVASGAGSSVAMTVAGVALPEPGLGATSALDYADVAVGAMKTLRVTVQNGSPVQARPYAVALAGADAADFTIAADACSGTSNATCTIDVTFTPSAASPRNAQLVVSSANLGTVTVALGGNGFRPAALAVTPDTGTFGSVYLFGQSLAQSFIVTNVGTVPTPALSVNLSDVRFFTITDGCTGLELPGGASCMFSIVYRALAVGTHEATVTVFAGLLDPAVVPLTGTGEPAQLQFTPSGVSFGDVFVGQSSGVKTLTVENTGTSNTGPLTARVAYINADLAMVNDACTGVDLAPGATCSVAVQVTPSYQTTNGGQLRISAPRGDTADAPLTFRGILPATLTATPGGADFGDVQLTENPRQVFSIMNIGDLDTGTMAVTVDGDDAADVTLVEDCTGRSLGFFNWCSLTASFSPSHLGTETAHIAITSPAATLTIPITANVLPAPTFTVSPDAVVLNPVAVGEPATLAFVVQGTAATPTGPLTVQVTGPSAGDYATTADDCSGHTLAFGQACTITLTLVPAATGSRNAVFVVAGEPGGHRKVPLTAIAFTQASLTSSETAITFAATGIGQTNDFGFVTIKNTGQLATGTLTAQLLGGDPSQFGFIYDTCTGVVLAANAECSVLSQFVPTKVATSTTTLVVSGAPGGTVTTSLTGTGLPPPVISSPITAFDFAPQETFTVIGTTIRIENVGGSPTDELHATLTGPQSAEFTADDIYCFRIDPGSWCELPVYFQPTETGQASATLVVGSAFAGRVTIALTGTATPGTKVVVSPDTFDFGFIDPGGFSPVQSFVATNIGQRDVTKFHTFSCDNFTIVATTCGSTLGPGASCRDDVVFHPVSHIFGPCRLVFVEDTLLKGEAELRGQSSL